MNDDMMVVLKPRVRDLGDFEVRRVLPGHPLQMVGPFIFFDHMGPLRLAAGRGMDVRPHPHIGLATVTYLFEGALLHRDSLGSTQAIRPGDVNWMTAGRGIVHSERTPAEERRAGPSLHGIQTWVALPEEAEESTPGFFHHPASTLPAFEQDGVRARVISGHAFGAVSPVKVFSPMLYAALEFSTKGRIAIPAEHEERGVYLVDGELTIGGQAALAQHLVVLPKGQSIDLASPTGARTLLLGGASLGKRRFIWWNFVSSSKARIEQAKADWEADRMGRIPGETERIPLPER
jgi:redox-sensitive bicupin YhaK (pirin superfamily)